MSRCFLIFLALFTLGIGCIRQSVIGVPRTSQTEAVAAVAEEKIPASAITLQFFGDIMLDRNVARNMGERGLDYIFEYTATGAGIFSNADLTIANLEGPFAPSRIKTSKSIAFRFDPKYAAELKHYGFSAFNLANNHSYDMGKKNVDFTRTTLAQAGVGYFGDELNEGPEFTWVKNDVAFIGLHNTYHQLNLAKVEAALKDAKQRARYVIINIHWGQEYQRLSNPTQRDLAHWLINQGADAIIGHHPHVVQEMEIYHGKPIFYSLGNFIFDQYFSPETQEGLSVWLTLQDGGVKSIHPFPFYSIKSQLYVMEGERREKFLKWMGENSRLEGRKFGGEVLSRK